MRKIVSALRFAAAAVAFIPAAAHAHPGSAIVVDRIGQIYFLDTGAGVWKIGLDGTLTFLGPPRFHWMAFDNRAGSPGPALPSGPSGSVERFAGNPALIVSSDYPIAMDSFGSLYFPSRGAGPLRLLRSSRDGQTSTIAALPPAIGNKAARDINGLAVGADGSVYYTEHTSIRRVSRAGAVSTVVANVVIPGCSPPPGESSNNPYFRGLAVDSTGVVYAAASGCGSLLRVANGKAAVILQLQSPWSPTAVALHHGTVYVLEYFHTLVEDRSQWLPRVRKISPGGRSVVIAAVRR